MVYNKEQGREDKKDNSAAELFLFCTFVPNQEIMALIVKIDDRSKAAKLFTAYIKTLPFVSVQEDNKTLNTATKKIIADAKKGKGITRVKDYKTLTRAGL